MMAEAAHRGPQEMFVKGAAAGGAGRAAKGLLVGTEDAAGALSAHPVLANLAARGAAGGVMATQGATTAEGRTMRGALTNFGTGAILPVGGREALAPDELSNRAPLGLHNESAPVVEPSAQRGGATVGEHTDALIDQAFNAPPGQPRVTKATPLPLEVDLRAPDGQTFTYNSRTGMLTRHADGQTLHVDEWAQPTEPASAQQAQQPRAPVPESGATIRAQFHSAIDRESPRLGVLVTPGARAPQQTTGFARIEVAGHGTLFVTREGAGCGFVGTPGRHPTVHRCAWLRAFAWEG